FGRSRKIKQLSCCFLYPFLPPAPRLNQLPAVGGAGYRRPHPNHASAFLRFDEKFLTVRFSPEPAPDSV
ncbi:hypothetical protein, partial [Azospirillum sp. TSH7]